MCVCYLVYVDTLRVSHLCVCVTSYMLILCNVIPFFVSSFRVSHTHNNTKWYPHTMIMRIILLTHNHTSMLPHSILKPNPTMNTNLKIFSISNETKLEQIDTSLSNYNVTLLMVSNQELYIYLCRNVYNFNWNSRHINIIPIFPLSILEWVWRIYAKNKERFYFSVTERIYWD